MPNDKKKAVGAGIGRGAEELAAEAVAVEAVREVGEQLRELGQQEAAEAERLGRRLESAQRREAELRDALERLQKELPGLERQLDQKFAEIGRQYAEVARLGSVAAELRDKAGECQAAIERGEELRRRAVACETDAAQWQEMYEAAAERRSRMREMFADEFREAQACEGRVNEGAGRRIHELEHEIAALKAENGGIEKQNQALKQQNADLTGQNQQLLAKLQTVQQQNADLQQQNTNLQVQLGAMQKELEQIQQEAAEAESEFAKLRKENLDAQRRRMHPLWVLPPAGAPVPVIPVAKRYVATGTVDDNGRPLANQEVIVYDRGTRQRLNSGQTDGQGQFAIPVDVPDVLIAVPGFGPARPDQAVELPADALAAPGA